MKHVGEEREDGTRRVYHTFNRELPEERSRTKPEFWKDVNINFIMKKYRKTGILGSPLDYREGMYGDFSSGEDFADRARKVVRMEALFMDLPAHVRSRFSNDPALLVDFLVRPENDEEAFKLGLKVRPAGQPAVPAAAPAASAAPVPPPASPVAGA